jgi:uncharacterized lipoprotein YehR (DUF1307 family)
MMMRRVGVLGLAFCVALSACSNSAGTVVEKFNKTIGKGDTTAALDYIDPQLKQIGGMKLLAAVSDAAGKAKAKGGVTSVKTVESKIDGDQGTVKVEDTYGDGSTSIDQEKVRKVDGKWYITM